jgi:hypothetical protein
LFGITFVVVDALVLFVQTDGLHDQIAHAQGHEVAVQPVAKGLVITHIFLELFSGY